MSILRRRQARGLGVLAVLGAAVLGWGVRQALADELAPLSAASVHGAFKSEWHDRQMLRNTTTQALSGRIYLTERGEAFNAERDPYYAYTIPAATTLVVEDLYALLRPGAEGAGTLRLIPDRGQAAPLWRANLYGKADEEEFGTLVTPFDPAVEPYHGVGTTLSTILSGSGYRDNPHLASGPDGLTGTWVYTNGATGNRVERAEAVAPNTTKQYTGGVTQLLGFEPEPEGQLDLVITAGSGRAWLSRMNNASNDPAYDEFSVTARPSPGL